MIHIFLMICHRKFHVFHKAFLVGHVINQGREIYSGRHACLTKEMLRRRYVLADVIIFVYAVPYIFWHYINVDKVS